MRNELAPSELYAHLRLEMLAAERARILEIRKSGNVAAEVVGEVLAMLDLEESMLEAANQEREELAAPGSSPRRTGDDCEHLASYPAVETTAGPGLRGVPGRRREVGVAARVPRPAAGSGAATPHPAATRTHTSAIRGTR